MLPLIVWISYAILILDVILYMPSPIAWYKFFFGALVITED